VTKSVSGVHVDLQGEAHGGTEHELFYPLGAIKENCNSFCFAV